jgi:hypothetical protein
MPISVGLTINGENLKLPDIGPLDPPGTMTDYNPERPRLIVVSCNALDDGGIVYETRTDNQILLARGLLRVLVDDTDSMEISAVLSEKGTYQRDLLTRHGLGHLTLMHYEQPQQPTQKPRNAFLRSN